MLRSISLVLLVVTALGAGEQGTWAAESLPEGPGGMELPIHLDAEVAEEAVEPHDAPADPFGRLVDAASKDAPGLSDRTRPVPRTRPPRI